MLLGVGDKILDVVVALLCPAFAFLGGECKGVDAIFFVIRCDGGEKGNL